MFQVVMNKQSTEMTGTEEELCKGLCIYIENLNKVVDIPTIKKVFNYAVTEIENRNLNKLQHKIKEIHKEESFTVHEINVEGLSKEDIENILEEIINKRK